MLKILLEMWNYRVIGAKEGEETMRVAEEMRPGLILMDVRLPLLDGLAATRQIRKFVKGGIVPVSLLSGCAEMVYKDAGRAAGGNDYLVKSLDLNELRDTLGKHIHLERKPPREQSYSFK